MTADTRLATTTQGEGGEDRDGLAVLEDLLLKGDLAKLAPRQRLTYYHDLCKSLGLNPYTRPFEYLTLKGKLVLYAKKDAAEQLRKIHGVSIVALELFNRDGLVEAVATARDKTGRTDQDLGSVAAKGATGEDLANIRKKAVTQAKRRATLSICGLGMLDETEVAGIPGAQPVDAAVVEGDYTEQPAVPALSAAQSDAERASAALVAEQRAAAASGQTRAQAMEPTPPEIVERWRTIRRLQAAIPAFDADRFNAALPKRLTAMDATELDVVIAELEESAEATEAALDPQARRAALNGFVDGAVALFEAMKGTRGKLTAQQADALGKAYEQGQMVLDGAITTEAGDVPPTERAGRIKELADRAGRELHAGEAPLPADGEEMPF